MQKKATEFSFPVNKELAKEILSEVHSYIENDIFRLLPNEAEVQGMRNRLIN
jgi:hypothetical protein